MARNQDVTAPTVRVSLHQKHFRSIDAIFAVRETGRSLLDSKRFIERVMKAGRGHIRVRDEASAKRVIKRLQEAGFRAETAANLRDLLSQCDFTQPLSAEEREWLEMPDVGRERIKP